MTDLGQAWVGVSPAGFTEFAAKAQAGIKAALKNVGADVNVGADTAPALGKVAGLRAAISALQGKLSAINVDVADTPALARIARLQVQLTALSRTVGKLRVDADIMPAQAKILALQTQIEAFSRTLTAGADPPARAWSGLWGILNRRVALFGGLATIGAVHLLADAIIEVASVLVPAGIALGAFGVAAIPTVTDIYTQMRNLQTVTGALNQNIFPLTGGFSAMADAVKPSVYVLFGEALVVAGRSTGALTALAVKAGAVLDALGARAAAALTSGGMASFLKEAPADLARIGDIIGNVFGTAGNILRAVPGYAQIMLAALDALTRGLEAVTGSGIGQWAIRLGLAFHGAIVWMGLAATATILLGNALLGLGVKMGLAAEGATLFSASQFLTGIGGALRGVLAMGGAMVTLSGGEAIAAGATGALAGAMTALDAVSPVVWVAAAVAGLVALGVWLGRTRSATQGFDDAVQAMIGHAGLGDFTAAVTAGLGQAQAAYGRAQGAVRSYQRQLDALTAQTRASGGTVMGQAAQYEQLGGKLADAKAQANGYQQELGVLRTFQGNYNVLLKAAGGNLSILNSAGITSTDIMNANAGSMKKLTIQVEGAAAAWKAMALGTGESAAGLNALNFTGSDTVQQLKSMADAESQLLGIITGGQTAWNDFQQSIAGTTAKFVSPSGLADAAKLAKGDLSGLNEQSLAFSNTLYTQSIPSLQKLVGSLQQQGISQQNLTTVTATGAKQILAWTGKNTEARSVLVALINNALGPGTVSLRNLNAWVKNNSTSLSGFSAIVATSTIKAGGLAGVLQNQLVRQFQASLFASSGAAGAVRAMTDAIVHQGTSSNAFKSARARLITDLESTGLNAKQAKQFVDNLQTSIDAMHGKNVPVVVSIRGQGDIRSSTSGTSSALPGVAARLFLNSAAGGRVPGSGNRDSVPALLTPGEVVVPRSMVAAGAVDHLRGKLPRFAAGGQVGRAAGKIGSARDFAGRHGRAFAADVSTSFVTDVARNFAKGLAALAKAFGGGNFAGGPGGGAPAANAALARTLMPAWGSGAQWAAWNYVAMRESGWNQFARNPSSGAYGIPQALPESKLPFAGQRAGGSNPRAQIEWMISYITGRYGSPIGAASHERAFNWYAKGGQVLDSGGWLRPGPSLVWNQTGKPEHLVPHHGAPVPHAAAHGTPTAGEMIIIRLLQQLLQVSAAQGGNFARALDGSMSRGASRGYYSG